MLDIVVPVYNEGEGILKLFDEIEREIKTPKKVLVVYDFQQDSTVPFVEKSREKYSFEIDLLLNSLGKGALNAIKSGINSSAEEAVLVMMADSSDRLDVVDSMYAKMTEGCDLVCGSRYMRGGKQFGGPVLKGIFSRAAGISLHFLTGIPTHDCTNSFKLYRKSIFENIVMESTGGFEIGLEICVKAYSMGYKIGEVPSRWYDRTDGTSNFHMWKWLPHYLHWYFYCIKNSWFKSKKNALKKSYGGKK
jgi:glycosyltransferase involved in cell wall biosynthesis